MSITRRRLIAATAGVATLSHPFAATAQAQPIRIVVGYAPGGLTDVAARLLAESIKKTLNRTVLVENKPGASGLIAARHVQTAQPDGDTLLFHNTGLVSLQLTQKTANIDAVRSFEPVAQTNVGALFLMVSDRIPVRTLPEFIAYAKKQPKSLICANSGIYGTGHLAAMLLEKHAGIELLHVPYKGSSEVATAMIAGDVAAQFSVTTESLNPYLKSGQIRQIAVVTPERSRLAPDVPAMSEFYPDLTMSGWFGFFAPAKTPAATCEKVSGALKLALEEPETVSRLHRLFFDIAYKPPAQFRKEIESSVANYKSIFSLLNVPTQ